MTTGVDLRSVPNLPGYQLAERKKGNHGRTQGFGYVRGVPMVLREPGQPREDKPKFVKVPKAPDTWQQGSFPMATSRDIFQASVPKDFDELKLRMQLMDKCKKDCTMPRLWKASQTGFTTNAHWASMTIADETMCAKGCTNYRAAM